MTRGKPSRLSGISGKLLCTNFFTNSREIFRANGVIYVSGFQLIEEYAVYINWNIDSIDMVHTYLGLRSII